VHLLPPVLPTPILYESHCHTTLCHHAEGTPIEYAEAALRAGLKGIIFTCHCPLPDRLSPDVRMSPIEYELYHRMVQDATEAFAGRLDVRVGLESDYLPGIEPWLKELHARKPLHHVLGSVHPQISDYRKRFFTGDVFAYQQLYFDHLASAAETGLFDTLAHPDLIKNMPPQEWQFDRIEPFIARALDRIAATGVAMELNTSGRNKALPEMNPGPRMLGMMLERGIPVVIGADAHVPQRVGDHYREALMHLQQVGFTAVNQFLDRQRQSVPITDALASLN
jgi:histidinol-phosphatase (PHP family)